MFFYLNDYCLLDHNENRGNNVTAAADIAEPWNSLVYFSCKHMNGAMATNLSAWWENTVTDVTLKETEQVKMLLFALK